VSSSGTDWVGGYDQLKVGSQCSVRYYAGSDAFVFERLVSASGGEPAWPQLSREPPTPSKPLGLRALSWEPSYMLKGNVLSNLSGTGRSDGPLIVFDDVAANRTGATLVLSALDHFSANAPQWSSSVNGRFSMWMSSDAALYPMQNATLASAVLPPPAGTTLRSVVLARSKLKRATLAWGSFQRQYHNTTRSRGLGTGQLSYWDDNAAGYSFWSHHDLDIWGPPENIYRNLKASYAKQQIPVRQWEIDPRGIHDPKTFTSYGWAYLDWLTWNRTLFPRGGAIKSWLLENGDGRQSDTAVYYMSPFSNNTVHRHDYNFVDIGHWKESHNNNPAQNHPQPQLAETLPGPETTRFYGHLMEFAKEQWGMVMLFIDFLCLRAPHLQSALPATWEAGALWLRAVGDAAAVRGVQLQLCMACPHQALASLDMPAATNARVNGDSGMAVPDMVYSSALAAAVGLGWSKDNLRLIADGWSQVRKTPSWPRTWANLRAFYSCISTGMHGPTCIFWANMTAFSLRVRPKSRCSSPRCRSARPGSRIGSRASQPSQNLAQLSSPTERWRCRSAPPMACCFSHHSR
jgi:hypothetical protein